MQMAWVRLIMKIYKLINMLAFFSLLLTQTISHAERIRVTMLVPGSAQHLFWGSVVSFAQAAANDLDIELVAEFANENTYSIRKKAFEVIEQIDSSDYMIAVYIDSVTDEVVLKALQKNIRLVLLNADIPPSARSSIGLPRDKFENFIAHIMPNDMQAGSLLVDTLINLNTHKRNQVIALGGTPNTTVSIDRARGLKSIIKANKNVDLIQYEDCDWSPNTAASRTHSLLVNHPSISTIWAASDAMALSALHVVESLNLKPNKDVFIGGMDWSSDALESIAENKLTATVGGHFMDGGWAMILIRDYHQGKDFKDDVGTKFMTSMNVITKSNVNNYIQKFGDHNWEPVDFKQFSKHYNPSLKKYNFSLDALLN